MRVKSRQRPQFVDWEGEQVPVIDACYLGNDTWFVVLSLTLGGYCRGNDVA